MIKDFIIFEYGRNMEHLPNTIITLDLYIPVRAALTGKAYTTRDNYEGYQTKTKAGTHAMIGKECIENRIKTIAATQQ